MPEDLLLKIATEINKRYKERYPTKLYFSYAADVDEKTIRRVLNGNQNMSILLLHNICCALDISLYELFKSIELDQQEQN
jgi:transcriptional regulator with XRE-family HTH domain